MNTNLHPLLLNLIIRALASKTVLGTDSPIPTAFQKPLILFVPFLFLFIFDNPAFGQRSAHQDTIHYKQVYGLAVKGEINKVLTYLDTLSLKQKEDVNFKKSFENRFKYGQDRTDYFSKADTTLNPLHRIFQEYWREGLLDNQENYDSAFTLRLIHFFNNHNDRNFTDADTVSEQNLPEVYKKYIEDKGFYCSDFGKTGKFYDFLVWKTMDPSHYHVDLIDDTVDVTVYFTSDFVSLGWLEYSRLGNYYPGGWATGEALYCVSKGYDVLSEKFKVNYLKHESQHFSDYERFPDLESPVLEYRGKLVEVYFADTDLYTRIEYFLNNAKPDTTNAHPYANFFLMMQLSKAIFNKDYENDFKKWQAIPKDKLRTEAKNLYFKNNEYLIQEKLISSSTIFFTSYEKSCRRLIIFLSCQISLFFKAL